MTPNKNEKRKYLIESYNPDWVQKFEVIKKKIQEAFGNKAVAIEHIGSTSISGMSAKPLIDVLVIVKNIHDLSEETKKMESFGYQWGENYIEPDTLIFYKINQENQKLENIHICHSEAYKTRQFLVERDFLRAHPDKAKEYSDLKRDLFTKFPDDYVAYRAGKEPFLSSIEQEAYNWYDNQNKNI